MDPDRLRRNREANYGKEMACNGIPGNIWRAVYEAVDIEEGNATQLVDTEITAPLRRMSEPLKMDV